MALTFGKKAASSPSQPAQQDNGSAPSQITPASPPPPSGGTPKFSWMKTGQAALAAQKAAELKAQQAKDEANRMRRFKLRDGTNGPEGTEARVTFLDGVIDPKTGVLEIPKWDEHDIPFNGHFRKFVCTAEIDTSQPCPICTAGDKANLVGALTLINHTPYVVKKGPNAGKTIVNRRELFVGKINTIAQLSKIAIKRGGTRGLVMDIARTGDLKPGVGDVFDVVDQVKDWNAFMHKHGLKPDDIAPAEYEKENVYIPPAELVAMGVGKEHLGPGTGKQKASGSMKEQL